MGVGAARKSARVEASCWRLECALECLRCGWGRAETGIGAPWKFWAEGAAFRIPSIEDGGPGPRRLFHVEQFLVNGKGLARVVGSGLFGWGWSCVFYGVFVPGCSEWGLRWVERRGTPPRWWANDSLRRGRRS